MRRRILVLALVITAALASACTNDDESSDPILEDGQVQPGEQ